MYEGSCLCGSISYEIDGELSDFSYCHCRSCRKASGSAHAANASVNRSELRLRDPEDCLRSYESSPGKLRKFCSQCGSPLFATHTGWPDVVRIRVGSLDTYFDRLADGHHSVSDKAPWHVIEGCLPQFED